MWHSATSPLQSPSPARRTSLHDNHAMSGGRLKIPCWSPSCVSVRLRPPELSQTCQPVEMVGTSPNHPPAVALSEPQRPVHRSASSPWVGTSFIGRALSIQHPRTGGRGHPPPCRYSLRSAAGRAVGPLQPPRRLARGRRSSVSVPPPSSIQPKVGFAAPRPPRCGAGF
jgi:hypothetical protein